MMQRETKINAALGVVLATALYTSYAWTDAYIRQHTPAEAWFEVKTLVVFDTKENQDPQIVYEREIKAEIAGTYSVIAYHLKDTVDTLGTYYCSGQGAALYKPGRALPADARNLSWLMNRTDNPCHFKAGTYKLVAIWNLTPEAYPPKLIAKESNVFEVHP